MPLVRLSIVLTLACALALQTAAALPSEVEDTLQRLSSQVRTFTLDNGLRLVFYRRGGAPVFAGASAVRVGGIDEHPGSTGISHMFEHMAFKGTEGIGTKNFAQEKLLLAEQETLRQKEAQQGQLAASEVERLRQLDLELAKIWINSEFTQEYERRGAQDLNAHTTKELTTYFVDLPANQFEFWCQLESERLLHPVLRQFYSERDVVMEERRMRYDNDPQGALYEMLLEKLFPGHPYRLPVIGYPQDIGHLTASALEQFRRRYYVPGNIAFAVVGNLDPDQMLRTFKRYFEHIPGGPVPRKPDGAFSPPQGEQEVVLKRAVSPDLTVSYYKHPFPHPDAAALMTGLESLTAGRSAYLYKELVLKQRLASSVDWMDAPGELFQNVAIVWMTPMPGISNQRLLRAFDRSLKEFLSRGVSEEELDRVKRQMAAAYIGVLRANHQLATDFAENEVSYGDWGASLKYYDQVMQLSAPQVSRALRLYLGTKNRTVGRIERVQ